MGYYRSLLLGTALGKRRRCRLLGGLLGLLLHVCYLFEDVLLDLLLFGLRVGAGLVLALVLDSHVYDDAEGKEKQRDSELGEVRDLTERVFQLQQHVSHVQVGVSEAYLRDYVVALDLPVDCDLAGPQAVCEGKGERRGPTVGGVDGVVEFWIGEENELSCEEEGRVGQDMELFDGSAVRGQLELVNGVFLLTVDILKVGLVEVEGLDGSVRHQTGGFCDVLIDIEKEEFVLGEDHDVIAHFLD